MQPRTILLNAAAPPKPVPGAACNGCGVCCVAQPCPLGMLLSGRATGPCAALQWDPAAHHYRCGVLTDPGLWLPALPLPRTWALALARRWIGAGVGCDSDLQATAASPD